MFNWYHWSACIHVATALYPQSFISFLSLKFFWWLFLHIKCILLWFISYLMWSVHFSKMKNAVFLYYLLNWHLPGYSFLIFSFVSRMGLWMAAFVSPQLCPNWIISTALGWIAIKLSGPLAVTLSISVFPVFPWVLFIILTCLTSLTHISSSRRSSSQQEDEREREMWGRDARRVAVVV